MSETRIFARPAPRNRQWLAYGLKVGAPEELAMILPIPIAAGTPENGVEFLNLEGYPNFFDDMHRAFRERVFMFDSAPPLPARAAPLKVEQVGSFVASFVPTVADFSRLDPRFRLPDAVWKGLGQYAKYGFAVFQLKKGASRVHPMAFHFPTARPDHLFFPTVHIHDGKVHADAKFDHELYCQPGKSGLASLLAWAESERPARRFVNEAKSRDLVAPHEHVHRRIMSGMLTNEDIWLRVA